MKNGTLLETRFLYNREHFIKGEVLSALVCGKNGYT